MMLLAFLGLVALLFGGNTIAVSNGVSLSAASVKNPLRTRSNACKLRNETQLIYADDENAFGSQAFVGRVHLSSGRPILVLEDIEDWLGPIQCLDESIILSKTDYTGEDVVTALNALVDGHLITSHTGCNNQHERLPYKVTAVEDSTHTITLSVTPATWKTSFEHIKVKFEYTSEPHELRAHRDIRRTLRTRQEAPSATSALGADIPSFTPPAPSPNEASTDSTTSIDLAFEVKDQALPVPSSYGVAVKCNDCKTTGKLDVTVAEFDVDIESMDISGSVTGVVTGFTGHADLSATVNNHSKFQVPLGTRTIDKSITIPGVGFAKFAAGIFLAGGWDFEGSVEASSFGFDMTVPDGASVALDVSSFDNTGVNGFDGTTVTPLPFVAHAEIDSLGLWTALRSTIAGSFSLDMDDITASGDGGVFIDTPILVANITKVQNVDANCQPSTADDKIASAIQISFSQALAVGAYAGFEIEDLPDWDPDNFYDTLQAPTTIVGPQGQQCRKFNNGEYEATSAGGKVKVPMLMALAVAVFMAVI